MFTSNELDLLLFGRKDINIDILKEITVYEEGLSLASLHIQYFWKALESFSNEERRSFLRFVWARSTLPPSITSSSSSNDTTSSSSSSSKQPKLKIYSPRGQSSANPDLYLPIAQTCFFSLALPHYSSYEILRKKLLYAIHNSPNMDADMVLHHGEGWD